MTVNTNFLHGKSFPTREICFSENARSITRENSISVNSRKSNTGKVLPTRQKKIALEGSKVTSFAKKSVPLVGTDLFGRDEGIYESS